MSLALSFEQLYSNFILYKNGGFTAFSFVENLLLFFHGATVCTLMARKGPFLALAMALLHASTQNYAVLLSLAYVKYNQWI